MHIPSSTRNTASLQAVVVGGGYIGLECAAAMQLNGLDVTLVFPEDRFMARLFTPEIADFYEKFYADKGIKIIKEDVVTAFEGEGQVHYLGTEVFGKELIFRHFDRLKVE